MATYAPAGKLPEIVEAFEKAKKASSKDEIVGAGSVMISRLLACSRMQEANTAGEGECFRPLL